MEIKITCDEGHDVEMTRRGFMNVKIKQEYDCQRLDYDTTFVSQEVAKQVLDGTEQPPNTFGE